KGSRHVDVERPGGAEIDYQLELSRQLDRQIAGLFALENAAGIDSGRAIGLVRIRAIAHKAAHPNEFTPRVQRGYRMACRQYHALASTIEKDRIPRDQERIGAHLGEPRKSGIDIANGAGIEDIDLLSDAASGGLNVIHLYFGIGRAWVHENSDRRGVGPQLPQQPQPLRLEVENKRAYARDVAAGAIEAGDETAPGRVGAAHVYDRDRRA